MVHSFCKATVVLATLLNPYTCNPDFRLNRTNWKVPVPSYTYNSYTHNPDRNLRSTSVRIKQSCLYGVQSPSLVFNSLMLAVDQSSLTRVVQLFRQKNNLESI